MAARPAKAAALACALLLAVECLVGRAEWPWRLYRHDTSVGVVYAHESAILEPLQTPPEILIIGNSRCRSALDPGQLQCELGLGPRSVINISLVGGQPWDALYTYREHLARLAGTGLLVVGVESWDLRASGGNSERLKAFGSLADKWLYAPRQDRPELVAGSVYRTYDVLPSLYGNLVTRLAGWVEGAPEWRWPEDVDPIGSYWIVPVDEGDRGDPEYEPSRIVPQVFSGGFAPDDRRLDAAEALIALAHENGTRVMVYRPPLSNGYYEVLADVAPDSDAALRSAVTRMAPAPDRVLICGRASDLGMPQSIFVDYGHHSRSGRKLLTTQFAAEVRQILGTRATRPHVPGAENHLVPVSGTGNG